MKPVPLAVDRQAFSFGVEADLALSPAAKQHFWRISIPGTTNADFETMLMDGVQPPISVGDTLDLDPDTGAVAAEIQSAVNSLIQEAQDNPAYLQDDVLHHSSTNPRVILVPIVQTVTTGNYAQLVQSQVIGFASLWLIGADQQELKGYFVGQFTGADSTPPTTAASLSSAPDAAGWVNQDVTVTLAATDNPGGTGVKQIAYSATGAQPIASTIVAGSAASVTLTVEGTTTITYSALDNAGNQETPQILTVQLDKSPPWLSSSRTPANSNGWNNGAVTVTFSASDALSGVAGCSPSTTLLTEGVNQSVSGSASDNAGNTSGIAVSAINIDLTPPTVTYGNNAGVYTVDQQIAITCTAADSLSGIAFANAAAVTGPAYSFNLGANSFSATAADRAGNTGSGSVQFTIQVTYDSLANLTKRFVTAPAVAAELCAKLATAKQAAARGNLSGKAKALSAYEAEVSARQGKSVTAANAAILIRLAKAL